MALSHWCCPHVMLKYVEKIIETLTLTVRVNKALQSAANCFRHMKDVSSLLKTCFPGKKAPGEVLNA